MVEMIIFMAGIYALVFGSIKFPWGLSLSGWRARLAALFLIAPLPLVLFFGRYLGRGLSAREAQTVFGLSELVFSIAGVGGALLFARFTRSKDETRSSEPP